MLRKELKKLFNEKIFWTVITASFAFTMIMFTTTIDRIEANAEYTMIAISDNTEAIQIVNADIKQILIDTSYIRGTIDSIPNLGNLP